MEVSRKRAESPTSLKLGGKIPKLDINMATENIKNTLVDVGQQFDRWCELMVIIGAITHEAFALDLLNWFERCPKLSAARREKGILPPDKTDDCDIGENVPCDKSDVQSATEQPSSHSDQRSEEPYKITLNDSCSSSPVTPAFSPSTSQDVPATEKEPTENETEEKEKKDDTDMSHSQSAFPVMVMAVPGANEAVTADPSTTVQYTSQNNPDGNSSKEPSDNQSQAENKVFGPRHVIEAVKMVSSGEMSIEDASVVFKVPKRTLEKKVKRYKAFQACISSTDETINNLCEGQLDNSETCIGENSNGLCDIEASQSPQVSQETSKGYYRTYNSDILPSVAMSVAEGQIRLMEACKQFNIPKSTLQARIKQYKLKRNAASEHANVENFDDTANDTWNSQDANAADDDVVNPSSMIASCNAEQLRQVIQALDEENEENTKSSLSDSGVGENPAIQAILEGNCSNEEIKAPRSYKVYNTAIVPSLVENVVQGKMTCSEVVNDYGIPRRTLQAKVKAFKEQKLKEHVVSEVKTEITEDPNILSNNSSIQILSVQSAIDPVVVDSVESDEMVLQKEYTDGNEQPGKETFQSDVENDSSNTASETGSNMCVDIAELRNQQELMKIPGLTGTEPIKKVMKLVEQGKVTMQQAARHFSIPRYILPKPSADGSPIVLDVSPPQDKTKNKFISSLLAKKIKNEQPEKCSDKWIVPKRPICRGSYKTYDTKLLPQILDLVINGHLTQLEAHRQFNIPKSTLQFKLKQMKSRMKKFMGDLKNTDKSNSSEEPVATVSNDSSVDCDQIDGNDQDKEDIDDTEEYMGGDADPDDKDWKPPKSSSGKVEYVWDDKQQEEEEEEEEEDLTEVQQDVVEFETLKDSLEDEEENLLQIESDEAGASSEEFSPKTGRTFRGNYKHYSAEILMEILQRVDQRKITQQQACHQYGIPKSTLQCKLKAYRETGSLKVSPRSRYTAHKRGHYKSYDSTQVPRIAKLVKNGKLKLKQACNLYNIPMSTLQQKIKKLDSETLEKVSG